MFLSAWQNIFVCVLEIFPQAKKNINNSLSSQKKSYSVEIETNCLFKIKFYAKRKMSVEGCSKYSSEQLKK